MNKEYSIAPNIIANLKGAIYLLLENRHEESLSNAEIGRSLGIYSGHVSHDGHISRTLLAMMKEESVVEQNENKKKWSLT